MLRDTLLVTFVCACVKLSYAPWSKQPQKWSVIQQSLLVYLSICLGPGVGRGLGAEDL
jgi:hypothetical protein